MAKPILAVVDYGAGNVFSVLRALHAVNQGRYELVCTDQPELLARAQRVVLPGQAAIKDSMQALTERNLIAPLQTALHNKPFLAICIGPQLLLEYSQENDGVACLGYWQGQTRHLRTNTQELHLKYPHIGWNRVKQRSHRLWQDIPDDSYFYFVHSYYLQPENPELIVGSTDYGFTFACAMAQDNVFGAQFHPEKSHQAGLQLLANFLVWSP